MVDVVVGEPMKGAADEYALAGSLMVYGQWCSSHLKSVNLNESTDVQNPWHSSRV